jgi:general secretion pathway protein C
MINTGANARSYFWALNMAFMIMGAYLLADTANFFVAKHLEDLMPPHKAGQGVHQNTDQDKIASTVRDYSSIIRRNLFGTPAPDFVPVPFVPVSLPPLPPSLPPPPVAEVVPPKVPLNMTLIGTVVSAEGPEHSYAVIEDGRTRRQYMYRIGDFLLQDAKLVQIFRTRVVISRGDEEEVLVTGLSGLKGSSTKNTPVAPPASSMLPPSIPRDRTPGSGVRQVSNNRWVMDREEVDDAVTHLPELLTKARVVPNFTDGKPDGFRIFAIREDSLYSKIGLQNGDILRRVNDVDVGNPQNFLAVFERLKGEAHIRIELIRNNKEEAFQYEIR